MIKDLTIDHCQQQQQPVHNTGRYGVLNDKK
jgi:hypothetical protein